MEKTIMEYTEFKEALKDALQVQMEGTAEMHFETLMKVNGVNKEAVSFQKQGEKLRPVVYLEDLYKEYGRKGDFAGCVEWVIKMCEKELPVGLQDIPRTWRSAKKKLRIRLIKKEWNAETLEGMPHKEYLDLAVVFFVLIKETEEQNAVIPVTNDLMESWGAGLPELWEAAQRNLKKEEFLVESVEDLLRPILGKEYGERGKLYVLANAGKSYGARGILRKDLLRGFVKEHGRNAYLLPSSVHEWLLLEDDGNLEGAQLKQMVCEVNGTPGAISPEECLSDSVYYYDRVTDEVEVVA